VHLCGWDDISAVVTDAPPPDDILRRLPRLGEIIQVAAG
jgi:DeoR/GlpR family transcriptional regulator of sugar metabolism